MKEKIWVFFYADTRKGGKAPKDNFRWMLNGAELYVDLETTHALFDDATLIKKSRGRTIFEDATTLYDLPPDFRIDTRFGCMVERSVPSDSLGQ